MVMGLCQGEIGGAEGKNVSRGISARQIVLTLKVRIPSKPSDGWMMGLNLGEVTRPGTFANSMPNSEG